MVEEIDRKFQTVIFWGGLRGALAIAIALSIPDELEERSIILVMTLGVVLFTLLVNGLTINPLMNILGLNDYSIAEKFERLQALLHSKQHAWKEMRKFAAEGAISQKTLDLAEERYLDSTSEIQKELDDFRSSEENIGAEGERSMVTRHTLMLERIHYHKLFKEGLLNEDNLKDLLRIIDNELDRIKEGGAVMGSGERPSFIAIAVEKIFKLLGLFPLFKPLEMRHKTRKIAASYERKRARLLTFNSVLKELDEMSEHKTYSDEAIKSTTSFYKKLLSMITVRLDVLRGAYPEYVEKVEEGILERCRLNSELETLREMYEHGAITDKVLKAEEEDIDQILRRMKVRPVEGLLFTPAELIAKIPCFAELSSDDQDSLTKKLVALSYLPGETIVSEGDHGDSLFIIGRGQVDILTKDEEGKEIFLANLKAGQFFGEVALLHPQPRTATVRASTPATLLELSKESLAPILNETPQLKDALEEAYKKRVLNTQLSHLHAFDNLDNEQREAIAAKMKYGSFKAGETVSDSVDRLFLIKEGEVEIISKDGKVATLSRGAHLGEDALLKKTPSGEKMVAKSNIELYSLSSEALAEIFKEAPEIKDKLMYSNQP